MELILDKNRGYSMESFYAYKGLTRQGVHQQIRRWSESKDQVDTIKEMVEKWRNNHAKMGSRVMYHSLINQGEKIEMGINKFEKYLSEHGLTTDKHTKKWPKTSDGKGKRNYPNLASGLELRDINQLIVGDISYYDLAGKWYYLFILKEVYSQRVVSIIPSRNMEATNCLIGIDEVVELRGCQNLKGCIHHSDNGSQYEYKEYVSKLCGLEMPISRATNCRENGSAEQVNHVTKNMYLYNWHITNYKELIEACKEFKYLNNYERCIKQLGYKTPVQFESYIRSIKPINRPIKQLFDFNNKT